ncbi:MAG: c-type cytochrome [Deltaproteobacteria bacterium]|nr:MAG: c-type cytochrome [Deltaproteobacteria bacterium]
MPHLPRQVTRATALAFAALAVPAFAFAAQAAPAPARSFTPWDKAPGMPPPVTPELLEIGGRVFRGACLGCHGEKGNGEGREGKLLQIPPRDFTQGAFISRSTPSGSLPLDTDLFRSIRHGFKPAIGMPAFNFLSDREVWAVIAHLKTFSERWKTEQVPPPVEAPPAPPRTAAAVKAGAEVYKATGCAFCHGEKGLADGSSAPSLTYDSGKPVVPANFTKLADFKCGNRPEDIFRTITAGMDGTPMPTFAEALTIEQRWQIVYFIQSLGEGAAQVAINR